MSTRSLGWLDSTAGVIPGLAAVGRFSRAMASRTARWVAPMSNAPGRSGEDGRPTFFNGHIKRVRDDVVGSGWDLTLPGPQSFPAAFAEAATTFRAIEPRG